MRSTMTVAAALTATLLAGARPVLAQAWPVEHKWSDQARPQDPTSGSFAYEYAAEGVAIAGSMTSTGEAFDCSKAAMTVVVRYAEKHNLEIQFTLDDPAHGGALTTVSSSDPRFHSPADFVKFYKGWINAETIGLHNTDPIAQSDERGGDLVLMRWNQLGDQNPFYPNDVWHTYYVGDPGKLLFYGNEIGSDNHPAPVLASSESERLDESSGQGPQGPAVYGHSPRRWKFLTGMIVPPKVALVSTVSPEKAEDATVKSTALNVRAGPGITDSVIATFNKGTKLSVEGVAPDGWLRVRTPGGDVGYVKEDLTSVAAAPTSFHIDQDEENLTAGRFDTTPAPTAPQPPRTGITQVLPGANGN